MATDTRRRMVAAAAALFRERGYDGAGFREVVARAGAARGAIYHHFPGGKAQLGREVVTVVGGEISVQVEEACRSVPPAVAVERLCDLAGHLLVSGPGVAGCPIAAVALSGDDPDGTLRAAAAEVFGRWEHAIANNLRRAGSDREEAAATATLCVAAVEGAVLFCRATGDDRPLRQVRRALVRQVQSVGISAGRASAGP